MPVNKTYKVRGVRRARVAVQVKAGSPPDEKAPLTVPGVASGLAGLILERNLREGRAVEIPSLGIYLTPENGTGLTEEAQDATADRKDN